MAEWGTEQITIGDGLERARRQGKHLGRFPVLEQKGISPMRILELTHQGKSIWEISQIMVIKKGTVQNVLRTYDKPTPETSA